MVLRAGTYVTGTPLALPSSGTATAASVSAEPWKIDASSRATRCSRAPSAFAMRAAAASSAAWRWP